MSFLLVTEIQDFLRIAAKLSFLTHTWRVGDFCKMVNGLNLCIDFQFYQTCLTAGLLTVTALACPPRSTIQVQRLVRADHVVSRRRGSD